MKILKTFIAIVFGLFAMTTTAANDIANFNRYANDNKRIMESVSYTHLTLPTKLEV